jgi:hypothetical protein
MFGDTSHVVLIIKQPMRFSGRAAAREMAKKNR